MKRQMWCFLCHHLAEVGAAPETRNIFTPLLPLTSPATLQTQSSSQSHTASHVRVRTQTPQTTLAPPESQLGSAIQTASEKAYLDLPHREPLPRPMSAPQALHETAGS